MSCSVASLRLFLRNLSDFDLVSIPGILGFKFVRVSESKLRLKERLEDMSADVKEWTALVSQKDRTGRDTVVGRLKEEETQRTAGFAQVSPPVRQVTNLAPPHFAVIIPAAIINPLSRV